MQDATFFSITVKYRLSNFLRKLGRVVYTHPQDNPRLSPDIPRNSQKWQHYYDKRTSVARIFKSEKNDFRKICKILIANSET